MAADKDIVKRVIQIVSDKLAIDPEQIKLESTFTEDLGADSLDVVELLMALEDEFGLQIEEEQAENIEAVRDIVTYGDYLIVAVSSEQSTALQRERPTVERLAKHADEVSVRNRMDCLRKCWRFDLRSKLLRIRCILGRRTTDSL